MINDLYPIRKGYAVTPSDTNPLPQPGRCRAIMVGVSGDVTVVFAGVTTTWPALAAGVIHPIYADQVMATGTTASRIVVGY